MPTWPYVFISSQVAYTYSGNGEVIGLQTVEISILEDVTAFCYFTLGGKPRVSGQTAILVFLLVLICWKLNHILDQSPTESLRYSICLHIKEANVNIYYFYVIRTWASCNLLELACTCSECVQPAVVSQPARGLRLNALYEVDQHYNILQLHVLCECCHLHWLEQWNWISPRKVTARLSVAYIEIQRFNFLTPIL